MSKMVFIKVLAEYDMAGNITPIRITWPDGREFEVDRLLSVGPGVAKSGGSGERYLCRIQHREVPLYRHPVTGAWWTDGK